MIAIDMDGTFAEWPTELEAIAQSMKSVVLTGTTVDPNIGWIPYNAAIAGRMEQVRAALAANGVTAIPDVVVCTGINSTEVAEKKAAFCRDHSVTVFIGDSDSYCEAVRAACPGILILKVWE